MKIVYYIICLVFISVFQPTFIQEIEIFGIAPNLFLTFVIMTGIFKGKTEGLMVGMIFGLIYDLLIGRMVGVNSLLYLYAGFGAGVLGEQFYGMGKVVAGVVGTFAGTILVGLLYYFARQMISDDIGITVALFRISFIEGIYNAVVSLLLIFPMNWLMKLMKIGEPV